MLQLKEIKKDYVTSGNVVHALKGVSLAFRKSEFVSVLGSSGCGKTTLLNIIGGLDQYTSGDLVIRGVSTKHYKDRDWDVYRNHRIGFVFQSYNLIPHQTVLENVELALTIAGFSKSERIVRAKEALERVGLKDQLHKKPNQLSGGQMQRVAIARALVNDPEILLADEPTGALDSQTSVQIMELIKEVAKDKLVIMVTHNPELAEKYSTRIVKLADGEVLSDSNPYSGEEESKETYDSTQNQSKKPIKKQRGEKASMSFLTALSLSFKNLMTKKSRTAITSLGGSIGIISVCLVLALSNGFNNYIMKTQGDMLSRYPLEIQETALDMTSIMAGFESVQNMPDLSKLDDKVYVNSFLTSMAKGMTVTNDIGDDYIEYLEEMPSDLCYAITYDTGVSLSDNLFTNITVGDEGNESSQYMSLSGIKEYYTNRLQEQNGTYGKLAYLVDYLGAVVSSMPGTSDLEKSDFGEYVKKQYDLLEGSFPTRSDEAVLVIGQHNDMTDLLLAQLGYIEEGTFLSLFDKEKNEDTYLTKSFDELLGKEFTLFFNDGVYEVNPEYDAETNPTEYPFVYSSVKDSLTPDGNGVKIKVKGILRLKDGLNYGCLSSGLNLTEALVNEYIGQNMQSEIVKWMKDEEKSLFPNVAMALYMSPAKHLDGEYMRGDELVNTLRSALKPEDYHMTSEQFEGFMTMLTNAVSKRYVTYAQTEVLRKIGGEDKVKHVSFYPQDFDKKDALVEYLDAWNKLAEDGKTYVYQDGREITLTSEQGIKYTDTVGMMLSMIQTMLNAITYVLVAFTAISLVVSSVMIGIITYVSVVERTKEIGVLRALGGRKKDIKHLFNAETFIIGLTSGALGVAITYLLSVFINIILESLTGIASLAALPVSSAVIMVVVSIALTSISGLIPASKAAKKDPVVALRTE